MYNSISVVETMMLHMLFFLAFLAAAASIYYPFLDHSILRLFLLIHPHENSVGLSSTTNPKPKGQPSISLPAQANLTQQKAEPLRCLALRTRGGRLKSSFVPWELSLPT